MRLSIVVLVPILSVMLECVALAEIIQGLNSEDAPSRRVGAHHSALHGFRPGWRRMLLLGSSSLAGLVLAPQEIPPQAARNDFAEANTRDEIFGRLGYHL